MAKILVIEDDLSILESITDWLIFEGFEAIGAANGRDGVTLALKHFPDLVISDINMPIWDGYRVLFELRANPKTALIPIVFLTANAAHKEVRYGMGLGADDYLTKPFTHEDLLATVRALLVKVVRAKQHTQELTTRLHEQLVHTLPHELRTPLVEIIGASEFLVMSADDQSPDQIKEIAQHILHGSYRLQHLIENFLLYAQIERRLADRANNQIIAAAAIPTADEIVERLATDIAQQHSRSQDLHLDLSASAPINIVEQDFTKIISELVDNAFKFSKPNSVVSIASRVANNNYKAAIVDAGRGMSAVDVEHIGALMQFDRMIYEQQGTGLGLIIAKRLTELYGGALSIESQMDQGTTIQLAIPLLPSAK